MSRSGLTIEPEGYNLIGSPTDEYTGTTNPGTNIFGRDARPGPPRDNGGPTRTHALLPDSPALDRGTSFGSTTYGRGRPRPVDPPDLDNAAGSDGSDIGAFELQQIPAPATPDLKDTSDTGQSNADDLTADDTPTFEVADVLADATVELLRDGAVVGEATASGASLALTSETTPEPGTYHYRARQSNGDGTSVASEALKVAIDTPPSVLGSLRANQETVPANTEKEFRVVLDEPVTDVDATDFALTRDYNGTDSFATGRPTGMRPAGSAGSR